MQAFHTMTGTEEDVVTYPEFMYGPQEEIIFHYRYGLSGSGHEIFNCWISQSQKWIRLLNRPLLDGRGLMNAYMEGPALGPDGYYHLIWVWRDTPDCATNHTLSYARSKNLRHWQSVSGENVELSITIDYPQLFVDTTKVNGGLINIGIKYGFDSGGNVIIAYHKYDTAGNSQLFLSRFQNNKWLSKQITGWDYRWDFKGYGSIVREITLESPKPYSKKGYCVLGYHHIKYGQGQIIVDEKTLAPLKIEPVETGYPAELDSVRSAYVGMTVNKIFDSGRASDKRRYLLRWETLSPNRDQKQEIKIPPNSMLELVVY
jgi:hypothetical protein